MTGLAKFEITLIIWILFDQLWSTVRALTPLGPIEAPDWDIWLSHFDEGLFFRQYNLVWDHSAWCDAAFNCRGPQGNVLQHQMCAFWWTLDFGTNCRNYKQVQVHDTEYERTRLLDTHNTYRDEVAMHGINKRFYGAANIRRMSWDYSLEDMAINWGVQCFHPGYKDDLCRRIHGFDYVSLTMERKEFPTNVTWSSEYIVEQWAESLARYHYNHPDIQELHSNFSHGPWDRATQMLWHSTYKVGCGVVTYTSRTDPLDKNDKEIHYKAVICYYAPPGNKVGKPIFKEGAPGLCPDGTRTRYSCYGADYPALCSYEDDPLNKKIPLRHRSRGNPPPPLYSQFVLATLTEPTKTTQLTDPPADPTTKARRRAIGGAKDPIAREGSGTQLLPGFASTLTTLMFLARTCSWI